jgi:RNA polymerase subunit RPABC4/transcription elongation factor Spt4
MGLKYCDKCEVAVDQAVLECPDCGHKKIES